MVDTYRYFIIRAKMDHGELRNYLDSKNIDYVRIEKSDWNAVIEEED